MKTYTSIWTQQCRIDPGVPLRHDTETDIAVVGAGIAGILTAYLLQEAGRKVIVLEAGRIAGGQTMHTTAKITSQHGIIYEKLIRTLGREKAKQYATANENAIQEYERLISEKNIACDFAKSNAYVYADNLPLLQQETEAAASLGLPASLIWDLPHPITAAGAVRFSGQAQFHPLKFLKALSNELTIYEHTFVRSVENDLLITDGGNVRAQHIVFACHYPFVDFPGMYFSRMHQERSYVLALKHTPRMEGMWIGAGKSGYSLRSYEDFLLFGGESHRTGENENGGCYERLRQKALEWFPHCLETACWSAQDCVTPDHVPYIGRYAASRPNWYVATGFQKWGMTSSMVSAMILRDLICEKEQPYAKVFDPGRFEVSSIPGIAAEGGHAAKGLTKRLFPAAPEIAAHIPPCHGGIVKLDGEKIGVCKDEDGKLYPVSVKCPHMGCRLAWNPDDYSWDCPCHGSRFDRFGRLLSGPAKEDITYE